MLSFSVICPLTDAGECWLFSKSSSAVKIIISCENIDGCCCLFSRLTLNQNAAFKLSSQQEVQSAFSRRFKLNHIIDFKTMLVAWNDLAAVLTSLQVFYRLSLFVSVRNFKLCLNSDIFSVFSLWYPQTQSSVLSTLHGVLGCFACLNN